MSICSRIDAVEVEDKRLGSKQHDGSRRQAAGIEKTRSKWETSSHAQTDRVEVGNGQPGSKRQSKWETSSCTQWLRGEMSAHARTHGCDEGLVFALETMRPKWETSNQARDNTVGVRDERVCFRSAY